MSFQNTSMMTLRGKLKCFFLKLKYALCLFGEKAVAIRHVDNIAVLGSTETAVNNIEELF